MVVEQPWYKNAVFYEVYVRAFCDSNGDGHGDLPGLTSKLDYIQSLGVDCIWLMPIYPSPLKDDGYDIADFYGVHPDYGTLDDFKELLSAAHARGLRVITDLVLNHTSDMHPWFQAARADSSSPYRNYYVWSDNDQRYEGARIIFTDTEKSNWTWDDKAGQYFWHRFYSSQPDLNYDNPAVRSEMIRVMNFWLDLGVDGFRADAVPYLFEREGTNCENLPETHAYLKELRRFLDENYTDRILLCEANQWPEDVRPYFGDGDEFHLGFHFPLMPRIFQVLRKGDVTPLVWILGMTPAIPDSCQWCTFLRNHDELTLEMVTPEERHWMWQEYAPEPRMRLNLATRRRLAPLLENEKRKIELAHSLLLSMPGSPVLYYGDEIGMGDDTWLVDRNAVRTPMQWDSSQNSGFSCAPADRLYSPVISKAPYDSSHVNVASQLAEPGSLLNHLRHMIAVRKTHSVLGNGDFSWVQADHSTVAAYLRSYRDARMLIVNNLIDDQYAVNLKVPEISQSRPLDMLSGTHLTEVLGSSLSLVLEPYQFYWLKF